MKHPLTVIFALIALQLGVIGVAAASPTASPSASTAPVNKVSPTASTEDKLIETFKEKVATKVAELRRKNDKPVAGRVTAVKGTNIQLKSGDNDYTVKIDENLTNIYDITSGAKKEIKTSDIAKNDYLIAEGPQLDKTVTANVIYRDEQYEVKSGKITEVNLDDDYLKILSSEKDTITLDIGSKARLQLLNSKTLAIEPVTMAKVKEGDTIHFIYKVTGTEESASRYSADRLLIIPQEFFQK